ncbi:ion channel DMI1-like isoform X1 [Tripterygium wilfordii]|uniref:Ion channel DMI1-like isoform X1 n=1 Tax=Tripterygium wilfordii TaxID=458696 RepID=A0A7J7CCD0_TRIWF|nr:probable ion channel SYM8 isoform X2 [Tripterygium wilfordii]KAF5731821.1 ion channel DMI1-like isoform X1 [Tripterygium wilfordii]
MDNEESLPNPSPQKVDARPLLKKSRTTISDDSHFPGPLFPAVRRTTTTPPSRRLPSDLRVSVGNDSSPTLGIINRSGGSTGSSSSASFSDRDWMYPSFLGPHTVRNRITVKPAPSSSNSQKLGKASAGGVQRKVAAVVDEKQRIANRPAVVERKTSSEKEVVSSQDLVIRCNSVNQGRAPRVKPSFVFYTLIFTCMFSVSYAIYLRNEVSRLEGENTNLQRVCICKGAVGNENIAVLRHKESSSFSDFGNPQSRVVSMYTVVITLLMPFVLYKYLDYLPQIKSRSKRKVNNKEEVPLKKRIAYMVDVCFSVYPYAKLLALLFATIFLIGFGGLALYAVSDSSFGEALWLSWTFIADSGNHADRVGTGPRIVSVSISSGGMLIFAMMLGLVSDAISEKVDSLRKGKSEVIEKNHILILGWSDKLGSVLKQLAIANKSVGGGVVVVLAERDKEEMEMDIAKLEFDFMGTSVICRSGSPLILADLKKVSVLKARAIIVLASDENADQSDARALRVVLSLTGVKEGLKGHVVVEMSDLDNEPLVKLVGGELIETVVAHDVIGRLMIQCALQPGLAQIWEDILGFENAEFYIKRWPQLDGMRFGDALISFPDAIPCGVKVVADKGKIIMNPDDNYLLKEGDEILVIAEDDDTYAPGPLPEVHRGFFPKISNPPKFPEKILFCGWRRDIDDMIMVLEAFLARGSELWMFNEVAEKDREKKLTDGGLDISGLENIKLVHRVGNAVIRRHLENLPLETFDSILILADESLEDSIVHSDSRCLATLLLIRDIQSKRLPDRDKKSTSLRLSGFSHSSWIREMQQASDKSIIISEILDSRTRNLVSVSRISDYVLSNELVSMALAMVAEDKQINRVLEELFAEEGNEMCIKPAEFYLFDQEEVCFYDIMVRGRQRNEVVIGYRLASADHAIINPPQKLEPRKWSLDDVFVVISLGE